MRLFSDMNPWKTQRGNIYIYMVSIFELSNGKAPSKYGKDHAGPYGPRIFQVSERI